ncbi:MAG: peptide chain release factor aRF-1 [Candidatus Micrarchaeota archaeon]
MSQQSKEMYEFKKQVKALAEFRGRGTELISLYIGPAMQISDFTSKLRDEYGQASNIKSKATQQNVQGAIERVLQYLKAIGHKAPPNGIAVFCGNVSRHEGKSDIRLFSIIPPSPMNTSFYRCESTFQIEALEEMLEKTGSYGLVVLDGKEATIAVLKGKSFKIIRQLNSTAHQKVMKGGQSAARYQRIHEEVVEVYYKRIGEAMDSFLTQKNFKGVIVGGPGPAKEDFMKLKPFNYQLNVLGVVDTGYTDETGIRELLEKGSDIIQEQEAIKEKKLVNEFMKQVSTGGLATYGYFEIKAAIDKNQVSKLLVSEGLELHTIKQNCNQCGNTEEKMTEGKLDLEREACSKCAAALKIDKDKDVRDLVTELQDAAAAKGVEIEVISQETAEGEQFFGTFHGLGAFLRYK